MTTDAPTDQTTETPEPSATDTPETSEEKDWQAEYEKLQRNSRKWEQRAKDNADAAKQLDELRKQHESDQERVAREAREATRAEVLAEIGTERVADAFRVAAAGRDLNVDDLLDDLNVSKFLGDDGTPDREAVQRFVDRVAPATESGQQAPLDLGQGARGGQPPGLNSTQLQRDLEKALGI